LTKALREIPEKGKSENGRINTDLNGGPWLTILELLSWNPSVFVLSL
jgi:hypothetical protein